MVDLTLNTFVAPTVLPRTQEHTRSTTLPSTFHRFMDLPVEVRLLVYKELMIQNVKLYRAVCYECCELKCHEKSSTVFASPQILRTSKKIYSEALPMLYSKKTLHMKCWVCEKTAFSPLWTCPAKSHDFPAKPMEHYHRHVKNIAIVYETGDVKPCDRLREFPTHWPRIESHILADYENTEHISLRIRLRYRVSVTFNLVRQSCKATTECVHDYKRILAEHSAIILENYHILEFSNQALLAALEEACDVVVLSNAQGYLKDTAFAVQSICWKLPTGDTKEVDLGCDKYSASDVAIKGILTGPVFGYNRWPWSPFMAKVLMDFAGISHATRIRHAY